MDEALQPDNVAVVVNGDSWASVVLAEAYVTLRGIPPDHVITVRGLSSYEQISITELRERILTPVLATLEQRGLRGKIDCLAYSADMPYLITFWDDLGEDPYRKDPFGCGALTGLTYLYEAVLARDQKVYKSFDSNYYARRSSMRPVEATASLPKGQTRLELSSCRFRGSTAWDAHGQPTTAPDGRRYLLSVMLGATSGRGTSLREAIDILTRAAAADGTRPAGTIYYMTNDDVRTQTRRGGFDDAIRLLKDEGVTAVIEPGALPNGRQDIAGAMVGVASFDMAASGGRILPGAICEHLTSWGGILKWGAGQTPLTEFLRHGAAGASGTVIEPYAIQAKFPDPFIQVHYARGASLAEAFYQSVAAPYQLLIVGDPLCRPWGKPRAAAPARFALPTVPGPVAADHPRAKTLGRGFRVVGAHGVQVVSGVNGVQPWWQAAKMEPNSALTIDGYIEVPTNDVYQFQVRSAGEVTLTVSGQRLPATGHGPWRSYPVNLAKGWHAVRLNVIAGGVTDQPTAPPLELNFGAVGAPPLIPQLWYAPQRGDQMHHVGLSPRVIIPEMIDDPLALSLSFAINGLQPPTNGTLAMRWELPAGSGWAIEPAEAKTRVTGGVVEPVPFRVLYRGAPFLTDDFFRLPTCHLQVQSNFGTESAESIGFPLEMILKTRPRPQIRVARAGQPPNIDGVLDDALWAKPATISQFIRPGLDVPLGQPTAAWLAWDDTGLYLAARCTEPNPKGLRQGGGKQHDAPVFTDDSIELFVAFDDGTGKYYQIVVNAAGIIYDGLGFDSSWNGEYRVATGREKAGWTAELTVPWATLGVPPPKPGTTLRILVGRNRHAVQPGEVSTWPAAPGGNHQPQLFGQAVFE